MMRSRNICDMAGRSLGFLALIFLAQACVLGSRLSGAAFQEPTDSSVAQIGEVVSGSPLRVHLGLGGVWKLGHGCPVRVELDDPLRQLAGRVEITTTDGDGVPVTYSHVISPGGRDDIRMRIRIGRLAGRVAVKVFANPKPTVGALPLAEISLSTADDAPGLNSDHSMIAALGSPMGIEALSRASVSGVDASLITTVLDVAAELPQSWQDYALCDVIVISTDSQEFLDGVSVAQWAAVGAWVRRGGGCVIALGGDADSIPDGLAELLPGEIEAVSQIKNPGTIETLVATDQPLGNFAASRLKLHRGKIVVALEDAFRRDVPWWVSYTVGSGTVQLVASSLDNSAMAQWPDRKVLWQKLINSYLQLGANSPGANRSVGESSYLGYSDLVGQLRATLDVFPSVRVFSFGQLAAILIGVLILVGPIDYLISVRWLGRPHMSWFFAGGCLVLISVGLTWFYHSIRPDEVRVNTAQIIDVDTATGRVAGHMWGHVYSGSAQTVDIDVVNLNNPENSIGLDWQGLPGRGLGGLLSQLNTNRGMPGYRIESSSAAEGTLVGVGIPAAGTKCVFASWDDEIEISELSHLVEISSVEQLSGELVNPLGVDLKEPALFYHDWYYSLQSRIPPNGRVNISYDTIPKDIGRRLSRRRVIDETDVMTPWDPADRDSLDRLLELMMFYKAASGESYTSLSHRYHPQLDKSNLMQTDQAVLIGRVDVPWAELNVVSGSEDERASVSDVTSVWCRFIIPVEKAAK